MTAVEARRSGAFVHPHRRRFAKPRGSGDFTRSVAFAKTAFTTGASQELRRQETNFRRTATSIGGSLRDNSFLVPQEQRRELFRSRLRALVRTPPSCSAPCVRLVLARTPSSGRSPRALPPSPPGCPLATYPRVGADEPSISGCLAFLGDAMGGKASGAQCWPDNRRTESSDGPLQAMPCSTSSPLSCARSARADRFARPRVTAFFAQRVVDRPPPIRPYYFTDSEQASRAFGGELVQRSATGIAFAEGTWGKRGA